MHGEDKQSDELKAFEAELASLQPRADGLDPRWRFLLAQEAAMNQNLPNGEVLAAGQFVCSRCGGALCGGKGKSRWAWPAAFSAMTTVAAALLVALAVGVERRTAVPGGGEGVSLAARSVVEKQLDVGTPFSVRNSPQSAILATSEETAYLSLRDQVLRFGVDSWRSPAASIVATKSKAEPVLSPRKQLDHLLKQEHSFGS
jgi:hypothetical protein